ncbi:adenosine deaminase [uncultured Treponema sp.]|uniref:adenosine deaminase n=1 Tax=uncultured Treponema sp. TaxID=162155 RepID=UPI0025DA3823|nr:adenosine deaminase [uncultured Treponema sp.]
MKYIDLHLHLDGAITVDIAKELAQLQNISLPAKSDEELSKLLTVSENCSNLNDFLACFDLPLSLLQTPQGLSTCVYLVAERIKAQGVVYAEIRFAPQSHTRKGMTQEDAIKAALEGLKRTSLKVNLIVCLLRGNDNRTENEETLELVKKYLVEDGGVVAIDLAGAEALYPTADYADLFKKAKELNIPFTIHAGEASGAESVRLAVEFGAKRIGHGLRIFENPDVIDLIKKEGITLEMCPTSNKQTHAIADMAKYPLKDYLSQGINVTLNTDDPGIEGTTITDEYLYMEKEFGLTESEEKELLKNSINAAFTSDTVKDWLKKELL